jgi:hypothetical protein
MATLVRSGFLRNVINHLKTDVGYDVDESEPGLYVYGSVKIVVSHLVKFLYKMSAQYSPQDF